MPRITNITAQQRRKDRCSLYIDGSFRLSLSQAQLLDAGLRVGDALSEPQIEELLAASEFGKALDQTYSYLSYRARSKHEVITYLRRKDYDDELSAQVVAELEQRRLIDDQRFATQWIEERNLLSPRSRYQLRGELREKGLAAEIIQAALEGVDQTAETASVVSLITNKHLLQRYGDQRKLIHHLAGKGFPIDTIKAALEQLANNESID